MLFKRLGHKIYEENKDDKSSDMKYFGASNVFSISALEKRTA